MANLRAISRGGIDIPSPEDQIFEGGSRDFDESSGEGGFDNDYNPLPETQSKLGGAPQNPLPIGGGLKPQFDLGGDNPGSFGGVDIQSLLEQLGLGPRIDNGVIQKPEQE